VLPVRVSPLPRYSGSRAHSVVIVTRNVVSPRLARIASFRGNGVDFLGYIVRPDYLLVRRRVVSRLKQRLREYGQKLVRHRPGYTLFRHDPATLAGLRATWASYRAHLKMANSHRLWHRLISRSGWIRRFFTPEDGLLVPIMKMPPMFPCLRDQYRFIAEQFPDTLLLFHVGRFYECYDKQAEWLSRLAKLRLLTGRRGFSSRCGVPVRFGSRCVQALVAGRIPVAVIEETTNRPRIAGVKPRAMALMWQPRVIPCQESCSICARKVSTS
jgi:RNA-directed DNA polymerase